MTVVTKWWQRQYHPQGCQVVHCNEGVCVCEAVVRLYNAVMVGRIVPLCVCVCVYVCVCVCWGGGRGGRVMQVKETYWYCVLIITKARFLLVLISEELSVTSHTLGWKLSLCLLIHRDGNCPCVCDFQRFGCSHLRRNISTWKKIKILLSVILSETVCSILKQDKQFVGITKQDFYVNGSTDHNLILYAVFSSVSSQGIFVMNGGGTGHD